MKKNLMRSFRWILLISLILLITGCSKDDKPEETKILIEETKEETKEIEEISENQNLLTGIQDLSEDAIGKRPVAVMVNNIMAAMPQYGVADADIIFEVPVEGDQTRFLALYGDYTTLPQICSVRSCRYYFPAISEGFDAFYVHWGSDKNIYDYLDSLGIDRYDGAYNPGGLFGRDQERLDSGYALEHTGYFDGSKFADYLQSEGIRVNLKEEKNTTAFKFNGMTEQVKPSEDECTKVVVDFGGQTATLIYDEETNTYIKENNGEPQIDGKTNNQLAFTNVFVLETEITLRDNVGRKNINWNGGDDAVGYYVSNGAVQKIKWSKASEDDYLKFFDESGKELSINRGKSYIAFNYAGQTVFE